MREAHLVEFFKHRLGVLRTDRTQSSDLAADQLNLVLLEFGHPIHAFDLKSGDARWEHASAEWGPKTWASLGSSWLQVLGNETLYAVTKGHTLHAINIATGKNRWTCHVGHEVLARPVLVGSRLFVSTAAEWNGRKPAALLAIDTATGRY